MSEDVVKAWVNGQKATLQIGAAAEAVDTVELTKTVTAIQTLAGGEGEWTKFSAWANASLPAEDLTTLTDAINTNNKGLYTLAVNDAIAKWKAAGGGTGPRDLSKDSTNQSNTPVTGFGSLEEQTAAINDPKYRNDPAHRALVEKRIQASRY